MDEMFTWSGHDCSTYGKLGDILCKIQTTEEAKDFWGAYIMYLESPGTNLMGKTASEVANSNIEYLMGYYNPEERERVYRLFPTASHPVFGHGFGRGKPDPTPDEAFSDGMNYAAKVAAENER